MLFTTLVFLATSFLAALAVPLQERAIPNILTDIKSFTNTLNTLESDLTNLAKTGANGLNLVDDNANLLIAGLQKASSSKAYVPSVRSSHVIPIIALLQAASDVAAHGTLSEADGQSIVNLNEPAATIFVNVLDLYVQKKPVFDSLAKTIPNLISNTEASIENIANSLGGYISEVEKNAPADVTAQDANLRSAAMAAVATALATFQS